RNGCAVPRTRHPFPLDALQARWPDQGLLTLLLSERRSQKIGRSGGWRSRIHVTRRRGRLCPNDEARARTAPTWTWVHSLPRAVATLRAFTSAATAALLVKPIPCTARIIGSISAANRSAPALRARGA